MSLPEVESVTLICQRALGLAEQRATFTSIEDNSDAAITARRHYDQCRRAVLEALDWNFARRRVMGTGVIVTATPPDLTSAWSRPPDGLRLRAARDGGRFLRYAVEDVIYTEAADTVQLVYTQDATNPNLFPPVFTAALEQLMASYFSMVYARSVNRSDAAREMFRRTMQEAEALEGAERSQDQAYSDGPWVDGVAALSWAGG